MKQKIIFGLSTTLVLAIIAIGTAMRLQEIGKEPVAPSVPQSQPAAAGAGEGTCSTTFTLEAPPTPTPTPLPGCWGICTEDADCPKTPNVLMCQDIGGTKRCVNPACPSQENCECPPLICLDLTATPSADLLEGNEMELTCKGSYNSDHPVNYAEFRFLVDGQQEGDVERVDATANNGEYEAVFNYTIPKTGSYRIECRVCGEFVSVSYENGNVASSISFKCTEWGQTGVASP